VLAIGYDVEEKSGDEYMIVKNSWDTDWGEDGYVNILMSTKYNEDGICGSLFEGEYTYINPN